MRFATTVLKYVCQKCTVMSSRESSQVSRPVGITTLSMFFVAAIEISLVAAISLWFPNGLLEPIWKLNPRARVGLGGFELY
jgi:hypothetical protein